MIALLNDRWCVIDDPLQWILQRRERQPGDRGSGYEGKHYCRQRRSLQARIREECGEVAPDALAIIDALPDWHRDRDKTDVAGDKSQMRSHG